MTDTTTKPIPTRMAHVTMRIPQETWDFYKQFANPRAEMRSILVDHAEECLKRG